MTPPSARVVFLRGANVGKHRRFLPASLAREMADHGAVNVGAVGTFVFLGSTAPAALSAEIARRLPFTTEIMICPAREIVALADGEPFRNRPAGKDVRELVTVLARKPRSLPALPVRSPEKGPWQVDFFELSGRFALTFWRPDPKRLLYPNAVVEETLSGIPGTTRSWSTIQKICGILRR